MSSSGTSASRNSRWLAVEATLDPRPGGVCRQAHDVGGRGTGPYHQMEGEFVAVSPPERVVFTWGCTDLEVGRRAGVSLG